MSCRDGRTIEKLVTRVRNWDALCLYGWHPYMYNPQLRRWLARIKVPTLALWGESDGIVKPSYGRAYSALIPGAQFATIDAAGHPFDAGWASAEGRIAGRRGK